MGLERTVNTEETVWGACYHMKVIILICCLLSISQVQAKNVVLFLGDGMGITTITAARIYEGQLQGKSGEENSLSFESFPNVAFIKTYSADAQIPDSAATMSAIMSGEKTRAGVLGVGPKYARGDCNAVLKDSSISLVEMAEAAGFVTGLVTTSRMTDATPAATYAHAPERRWENDAEVPNVAKSKGCTDIAQQFVTSSYGDGIDFALGGGRSNFLPETQADPEYPATMGSRTDGRNLVDDWLAQREGRVFVWNNDQLTDVSEGKQVLGLFEPKEMLFEAERSRGNGNEPSLEQMTERAITFLANKNSDKGFFLVIEGARIDHANHNKNPFFAMTDTIELSDAVRKALTLIDLQNTLVLVTADHSSSLAFTGYPERGMPVLGSLSYPGFSNSGGFGFQSGHLDQRGAQPGAALMDPSQALSAHAGEDVPAYAIGLGADQVRGTMEQHRLFEVLKSVLEL